MFCWNMSTLLERMSDLLEDVVRQESQDSRVVGILVFGSFVKGKVRRTSDLDIIVVKEDIEEFSRKRQRIKGILLEIYTWPLKFFRKPFCGEMAGLSTPFLFGVMRTGRILYDPKGTLQEFKRYAQTRKLPNSIVKSQAERAKRSLHLAQELVKKRELEGAELEIRRASGELARAILLKRDILEIISPKVYLPHLRNEVPDFYSKYREIHNIKELHTEEIEAAIHNVSNWRERIIEEVHRMGKEDWLKAGGVFSGAQTELSNAKDCLESEDLEAATLQVRWSAMLVASAILRLLRGASVNSPSKLYAELLQRSHPYANIVKSVMSFSGDEPKLEEHIKSLENILRAFLRRVSTRNT